MSNDTGFQQFTIEEHARKKGMWGGALTRCTIANLRGMLPDGTVALLAGEHTPALLKLFDEIVVNATDHERGHRASAAKAERVTRIDVTFEDGRFTCENDGPGLPVVVHRAATAEARERGLDRDIYVPEVAFCRFMAGTNMEKAADCVKGGINGVGAKLANVHSSVFEIETVDQAEGRHLLYRQRCGDRMRRVEPPELHDLASAAGRRGLAAAERRPRTRVSFRPCYGELGYADPPAAADAAELDAWLRLRVGLAAAYVGPRVRVTYNGVPCATTSAAAVAAALAPGLPPAEAAALRASAPPFDAHPWDVAVAVGPALTQFTQLTVINGVVVAKGPHVTFLKGLIADAVQKELNRLTGTRKAAAAKTTRELCRRVLLVAVGALPGAEWSGQRKDELNFNAARLGAGSERAPGAGYHFAPSALKRIAVRVAEQMLAEELRARPPPRAPKAKKIDKYTPARLAGRRGRAADCMLLVAEGDSALALLRAGLSAGRGGPSFETCGLFSLGGVIMNALRKTTEVETAAGETLLVRSEQLEKNKVLSALNEVLGLQVGRKYETPEERSTLHYGCVVACVDQDLDGCGKILSLLLVYFERFWPALVRAGFVRRFLTPVVRVYPARAGEPVEFFYEEEMRSWIAANGGEEALFGGAGAWRRPVYYKGLAAHNDDEVKRMFARFHESIYTFSAGERAAPLFSIYFGPEAALRRAALASPVEFLSAEATARIRETRLLPCETHLETDTKAYKADAIMRQIPSVLDGLTRSRRKVLAGAMRRFASGNKFVKVFQLCGHVAEHMSYHHGDASLNSTIIGMAQAFPGAFFYPLLEGSGRFGTRHLGGDDAGSPRYVSVRLNAPVVRALFPAADLPLLPHVFEEGERAEPQYFVPVLPTAVLESGDNPSEGWRFTCWGRDLAQAGEFVRAFCRPAHPAHAALRAAVDALALGGVAAAADELAALAAALPLDVNTRGFTGTVRGHRGKAHSFGRYEYDARGNTLRVLELPMRVATRKLEEHLGSEALADLVAEVRNYSTETTVDVSVKLTPGAYDKILAKYGPGEAEAFEAFALLRAPLHPRLNFVQPYDPDEAAAGGVVEFGGDYHAVVCYWLPFRQELYRLRLEREAILLELRAGMEADILRYIPLYAELALPACADVAEAEARLRARGFPRYDRGVIAKPKYRSNDALRALGRDGPQESCNHDYLLGLTDRDKPDSARRARAARLEGLRERLAEVRALLAERPFAGASLWLAEAAEAEAAMAACGAAR